MDAKPDSLAVIQSRAALRRWCILAGLAQISVALASLSIPRLLGWKEQTAKLDGLTRQVFWTYAGYILGTNLFFGLLSTFGAHWLIDGSGLARAVCGFIAAYWGVRIVLQFAAYRRHEPKGRQFAAAKYLLLTAFAYCTGIYGAVALALV